MQDLAARVADLTPTARAALARRLADARAPGQDGGTLVAYVVARPGLEAPAAAEVRAHLAAHLPAAMVPAHVVTLPALPRTPNGKVDRAALPPPEAAAAEGAGESGFEAPRTPLEAEIAAVWANVLRVDRLSIHDGFFDVGGDSLLGMQVIALLRRAGHEVTPAQLVAAPTVAGLAAALARARVAVAPNPVEEAGPNDVTTVPARAHAATSAPTLPNGVYQLRAGTGRPFFLVHNGNGGHELAYAPFVAHLGGERPVFGLIQPDVRREPPDSLEALAARYVDLIRQLQPDGPYLLGGHCLGGVLAYEMAQQLADRGERAGAVVLFQAERPGHDGDPRSWLSDAERATTDLGLAAALQRQVSARRAWLARWYRYYRFRLLGELGTRWPTALPAPAAVTREHRFLVNWRLQLAYRPRLHRGGPVYLLRPHQPFTSDDNGWNAVVPGGVRVLFVDERTDGSAAAALVESARRTRALLDAHD